jgi:hypothetical protein
MKRSQDPKRNGNPTTTTQVDVEVDPAVLSWANEGLSDPPEFDPYDYGPWDEDEEMSKVVPGPNDRVYLEMRVAQIGEPLSPIAVPLETFCAWISQKLGILYSDVLACRGVRLLDAKQVLEIHAMARSHSDISPLTVLKEYLGEPSDGDMCEESWDGYGSEDDDKWYLTSRRPQTRKPKRDGKRKYLARIGHRVHKPGPESNGQAAKIKRSGSRRRKDNTRRLVKQGIKGAPVDSHEEAPKLPTSFSEIA